MALSSPRIPDVRQEPSPATREDRDSEQETTSPCHAKRPGTSQAHQPRSTGQAHQPRHLPFTSQASPPRSTGQAQQPRPLPCSETPPNAPVHHIGGRLELFWERWKDLFPGSPVPYYLQKGIRWCFTSEPPLLTNTPISFPTSPEQLVDLRTAAAQLLAKGATELLPQTPNTPGFYSRLFLRPKPSGELRPIIDLSELNTHIQCNHFKMETPHSIQTALQPGEWTFQIDIKDAYLHIPVHRDFRKYLRFTVGTEVYQFKTLPFGLSVAPKIFTETLRPVLGLLRSRGIKIHAYLDDWLGRALSQLLANHHGKEVTQLLMYLGWVVNWEKTDISGTQSPIFLGLQFRLDQGRVKPGPKAWNSISKAIEALRPGLSVTARAMAAFIGMLKHWAPYIFRGRLSLRSLQHWTSDRWQQRHCRWNDRLLLDRSFTDSLPWWTHPERTRGVPLHPPTPSQDLYTDASTTGWGGSLGTLQASGTWTTEERNLHINQLEMLAVLYVCQRLREHLAHRITRVHIDNSTTVAHLRKEGGTRSWPLTRLTFRILKWCDKHKVVLVPVHIAGIRNILADSLSRKGQLQSSEWALSPHEVSRAFNHSGWPTTDLMATAENRVVKRFISPVPHPEALGVDVFSAEWPDETLYLFPPTTMVPRMLQLIREKRPRRLLLVASMSPIRTFHPDLLELTTTEPLPVARSRGSLWQRPAGQSLITFHSQPELFNLGLWEICLQPPLTG